MIVTARLRPDRINRAPPLAQERTLDVASHALEFIQVAERSAVRTNLGGHTRFFIGRERPLDEIENAEHFDRTHVDTEVTAPGAASPTGEGADIGPELTGGERGNVDHWLDNILDPNALIGQGYELHQVEKTDGSIVTGMLAAQNDSELVLKMVGVETRELPVVFASI